jgi:hypothetical protein
MQPDPLDNKLTQAPLWKLFRLPKWSRELRECWAKLENGEYEWA